MSRLTVPPPGLYVPAVLFFEPGTEELDVPSIKSHVLRLARAGVTGILVQGSNGEAQHLSRAERKRVIQITKEVLIEHGFIKGQGGENDVVIIAGTGAQSAKETKVLCEDAAEVGAQFVLVLTPSVWPPLMTRDNIIKFHREVADASPVPTMIYNFPTVTAGLDLDSSIIAQLAQHPNIVGTKLSCGNIGKLHRLTTTPHITPSTFAVFPGRSDVFLQGLLSGSSGAICALPNLFPCVHVKLWKLWKEGKVDEAMKIQGLLAHGDWAMSKIGGVSGVKGAVSEWFGYGTPTVRSPLTPADPAKLKSEEAGPLEKLLEMERALEEASKQ